MPLPIEAVEPLEELLSVSEEPDLPLDLPDPDFPPEVLDVLEEPDLLLALGVEEVAPEVLLPPFFLPDVLSDKEEEVPWLEEEEAPPPEDIDVPVEPRLEPEPLLPDVLPVEPCAPRDPREASELELLPALPDGEEEEDAFAPVLLLAPAEEP
ncbi:hypothetical protein EFA69_06720 [Rufibacter immobilis]|uniref:Uncharacterized protein n=1 Tax=Rufibacter immobilis TaxID=1348778 RepID=A0A3M9N080_9BACT|nr:hypothetical protein EFA69_06720 [Rufibacter immobilis]